MFVNVNIIDVVIVVIVSHDDTIHFSNEEFQSVVWFHFTSASTSIPASFVARVKSSHIAVTLLFDEDTLLVLDFTSASFQIAAPWGSLYSIT
jgi:hypothetical protein